MRCFIVLAVMLLTSAVSAQQPNLIRGRVLKPDGTPARNCQGLMWLRTHELDEKGGLTEKTAFSFQTDQEGFLHSLRPVFRSADLVGEETLRAMEKDVWMSWEKMKGKRALTWIYLAIPKVGALLTRRFFWVVGEPLPTLQLKPPARLQVELIYPILNAPTDWLTTWISRPDDPSAQWNAEDLEWLPADEWLSVNRFSVRLSPLEERKLLLPIMPASEIPVRIQVWAHPHPPTEKLRPPLEFGFQLLPWSGWDWEGIVKVDRTDPYQFMLVPPKHILRLPIEQIPMRPLVDKVVSLDYNLEISPIAEVEVEVVNEKGEPLKSSLRGMVLNREALEALKKISLRFSSEDFRFVWGEFWEQTSLYTSGGYILGSPDQPQKKFLITRWVPLLLRVYAKDCIFAFPLKTERAKRLSVRLQVNLPEREPPHILKIKTGRLEGVARTLEGKPVANFSVIAQFAESGLVDWLSKEDAVAFYTETDEKGQFVFPALPEGKYDLWVDTLSWVGCVEAVVRAGKTTKVNLIGDFVNGYFVNGENGENLQRRPITLRLQFPDGTPFAGYRVQVAHGGLRSYGLTTDEHGSIALKVAGDKLEVVTEEVWNVLTTRLEPEQKEVTLTVSIPLYGLVEGQVLLPDGTTNDRVIVTAWRLAKRNDWMSGERVAYWRVLPDGRFFGYLREGVYVFKAEPIPFALGSYEFCASLSPPVFVKAGEVAKVRWQLNKRRTCSLELTLPPGGRYPSPIGMLFVRSESDEQTFETRYELPLRIALVEPLASLGDEKVLWKWTVESPPGFYRFTSWDWEGNEFGGVVRVGEKDNRVVITPPASLPTLTVTGKVVGPNGQPVPYAVVALYDPDQQMSRFATVCDEKGNFHLKARVPTKETLERQHLDTLLPNSNHELWLVAWKFGYGHSLIQRLRRPTHSSLTVDVGTISLSHERRLEGKVMNEKGEPIIFAGVVMLPADPSLFSPSPSKEVLWQELTAFENTNVGSLPHAQTDIQGRFQITGLREGRYLLVTAGRMVKTKQFLIAYRFVQIPSPAITFQLSEPKGTLEGSPQILSEALPLAEVKLAMPCWRDYISNSQTRTDAAGNFQAEGIPISDGVPLLVRLLHRNGIAIAYNPPKVWRYQRTLLP